MFVPGYKIWENEVFALFRLRKTLRNLDIWEGDILLDETESMEKLEQVDLSLSVSVHIFIALFVSWSVVTFKISFQDLSHEMGKVWKPRSSLNLDEVILNPHNGDSDEYILPLVACDLAA